MVLNRGYLEQCTHSARYAPMPTDDLTDIPGRHLKAIHGYAILFGLDDPHFVGMIDKGSSHVLDQLSGHSVGSVSPATCVAVVAVVPALAGT
jgi:hypothetical protein